MVVLAGGLAFHALTGDSPPIDARRPAARCAVLRRAQLPSSAARRAPAATAPRRSCGAPRSTNTRCSMPPRNRCSATSTMRASSYYGVPSRFFRKDGKFFVETDGPDGKLATFEVKYTFGVDPLQQYLIAFPDGRLQALSIAWDSRPKDNGGQRWFHLYPNEEIRHDDVLHWTKLNQNWNFMCAECHSTGVRKNYDAGERSLRHHLGRDQRRLRGLPRPGLASRRLGARASKLVALRQNRRPSHGAAGSLRRAARSSSGRSIRSTGNATPRLHPSDAAQGGRDLRALSRTPEHALGGLDPRPMAVGHASGRAAHARALPCRRADAGRGLQLRLVQAEQDVRGRRHLQRLPRAARRQAAAPGDGVCLQCHASDKYAAATHHHHEGANPPLACASCHMPARTYMVVDRRHDHSLRIPRPDLSAKLGTPNACNDCHTDKSAEWAAAAVERWHGPDRKGFQNYAEAFHAGMDGPTRCRSAAGGGRVRSHDTGLRPRQRADRACLACVAGEHRSGPEGSRRSRPHGAHRRPRHARKLHPPRRSGRWSRRCLSDSSRGVRLRAVALLAAVPTASQPPADRDGSSAPRPSSSLPRRSMPIDPRRVPRSAPSTRGAAVPPRPRLNTTPLCDLSPQFAPAAINLADLYRGLGRDGGGRGRAARGDSSHHHRMRGCITRSV